VVLTWFNAFTLYIYLPAYFVFAYAVWTRRWWLATASAAAVACHMMWVSPDFRAATPYVAPESTAAGAVVPLKIYYANVRGGSNMQMDEVFAEARATNPDVIVLVELQSYWWRTLMARGPVPGYPYGTNLPNRNSGDVAVFSRLPVRRMEEVIIETRSSLVLDIPLEQGASPRGEVQLVALHSPRPKPSMIDNYYVFWEQMLPIIADRHGPQVVIGDFNATQHSRVYAELLALGLRSAHVDRGRGYVTTWPNGVRPFPPIRIDQAMLSPEVECVSVAEAAGPGTDHKPLVLDLRIHLPASAAAGG
jgi:endonuclease/exonuclease/phosphatase (EEP) superfamily protein YafD